MKKLHDSRMNPLRAKWPALFTLLIVLLLSVYALIKNQQSAELEETARVYFGAFGAITVFYLAFYQVRKVIFVKRMGSMESWRQAHLYVGMLCVLIILIHVNFEVSGLFGTIMVSLLAIVVLSGVVGELLYRMVPLWLSKYGAYSMSFDEDRKPASEFTDEAETFALRGSDEFKRLFDDRIRPLFATGRSKLTYLLNEEVDIIRRRQKVFGELNKVAPAQDRFALKTLENLLADKERLEFKWARIDVLRWWLTAHVPLTAALLMAILIHVTVVLYF